VTLLECLNVLKITYADGVITRTEYSVFVTVNRFARTLKWRRAF